MEWSEEIIVRDGLRLPPSRFHVGEVICVRGVSGAGKSTLMKKLADYISESTPTRMMNQDTFLYPSLTCLQYIRFYDILFNGVFRKDRYYLEHLRVLQIDHLAHQKIGSLENRGVSGGEKKRVMLACVLLTIKGVVLLDEPYSGLDEANICLFHGELTKRCRENAVVIMTIHGMPECLNGTFDRYLDITDSRIYEIRTPSSLMYTKSSFSGKDQRFVIRSFIYRLMCDGRTYWKTWIFRLFLPILIVFSQQIIQGRFHVWYTMFRENPGDLLTLGGLITNFLVLMFTSSILPLTALEDSVIEKINIQQEVYQKMYSSLSYFIFSFTLNVVKRIFMCTVMGMFCFWSLPVSTAVLLSCAVFQVMMITDTLLWWTLYFIARDRNMVMLICTMYISMSFMVSLGMFVRVKQVMFIQWLSSVYNQFQFVFGYVIRGTEWIVHLDSLRPKRLWPAHPVLSWLFLGIFQILLVPVLVSATNLIRSVCIRIYPDRLIR